MFRIVKILPPRSAGRLAPVAIGAGLAILSAALIWRLPPVAGMALVVLGATAATIERYRHSPILRPIVIAHAATYIALYALFLGATLQAPAGESLGTVEIADLLASLGFLAASAFLIVGALRGSKEAV